MPDREVCVFTGGAGGIAFASARRLASRGPVLLADLEGGRLTAAVSALRAEGVDAHAIACDVADPAAVARLARRARELGRLGTLVHTAGLAPPSARDPRRVLEVNLAGTARVLDAFVALATVGSVAICIASLAGHRGFAARYDELLQEDRLDSRLYDRLLEAGAARDDVLAAYSLSKRGVILECRRRAADWGARGGRVVSVSPGLVLDTAIGEGAASIHAGAYASQSALGRAGRADDVAAVVDFLASPAAGYVTGCDLLVDGGVVAHMLHHADAASRSAWNEANYAPVGS